MKNDWKWWASVDGGDVYPIGPYDTREELIRDLDSSYSAGTAFLISETAKVDYDYRPFGSNDILDALALANEDLIDPDGMGDVMCGHVTEEQFIELEGAVNDAVERWGKKYSIEDKAWSFADSRNLEAHTVPAKTGDA